MQTYTYKIGWSKFDKWYYGMRAANKVAPHLDLWKEYFTSSKYVHEFREKYGEPDVIEVDRCFSSFQEAAAYEIEFLKENDCVFDDRWLNKAAFPLFDRRGYKVKNPRVGWKHSPESRKKMSEAHMGKTLSTEHKEKIGKSNLGREFSEETRKKISNSAIGNKRFQGKSFSPETIKHLSNIKAKTWWATNPNGLRIKIVNMRKFCENHDLAPSAMSRVMNGKQNSHKGWTR